MLLMFGYRCQGCRRTLKREDCVFFDDPMAPFGPELLCPYCDSLVTPYTPQSVVVLVGAFALLLGMSLGWLLNR
jgi:hypothetical protein